MSIPNVFLAKAFSNFGGPALPQALPMELKIPPDGKSIDLPLEQSNP